MKTLIIYAILFLAGWKFTEVFLPIALIPCRAWRDAVKWLRVPLKPGLSQWNYIRVLWWAFPKCLREQTEAWAGGWKTESGPTE